MSSFQVIMRPEGRVFQGTTHYSDTNTFLRTFAGHVDRLNEFAPNRCEALDLMVQFLRILFNYNVCCFLGGGFVCHVAGAIPTYTSVVLYIATNYEDSFQRILFQRQSRTYSLVPLGSFRLRLREIRRESDCLHYTLFHGSFSIDLVVTGLDQANPPAGLNSSVDLVHFVWNHLELLPFKRYAIALLPHHNTSRPRLFFLAHHRSESDGYKALNNCLECPLFYFTSTHSYVSCLLPGGPCNCPMCCRRVPSLIAAASHVVFTSTFNIEHFEFTANTTYDEYVFAVNSGRVPQPSLLPPDFPTVTVLYYWHIEHPMLWRHSYCPGSGPKDGRHSQLYNDPDVVIRELVSYKHLYWCGFCEKPLFFSPVCRLHHPLPHQLPSSFSSFDSDDLADALIV